MAPLVNATNIEGRCFPEDINRSLSPSLATAVWACFILPVRENRLHTTGIEVYWWRASRSKGCSFAKTVAWVGNFTLCDICPDCAILVETTQRNHWWVINLKLLWTKSIVFRSFRWCSSFLISTCFAGKLTPIRHQAACPMCPNSAFFFSVFRWTPLFVLCQYCTCGIHCELCIAPVLDHSVAFCPLGLRYVTRQASATLKRTKEALPMGDSPRF